jgi:hypothetical protein
MDGLREALVIFKEKGMAENYQVEIATIKVGDCPLGR